MIPARVECPCCGTKFTQDDAGQTACGECRIWELDPDAGEPVDFGPSARDIGRSMENYRRASGIPRRR